MTPIITTFYRCCLQCHKHVPTNQEIQSVFCSDRCFNEFMRPWRRRVLAFLGAAFGCAVAALLCSAFGVLEPRTTMIVIGCIALVVIVGLAG